MGSLSRIPGLSRALRLRDARDASLADIEAELRFHVETRIDELVARGHTADDARATALRELGDWHRYAADTLTIDRQRAREIRMREVLESVFSDVAYAWRGLRRQPIFTSAAILTLTLGLGATLAVFSAVSGALLRALPFRDADRIVHIGERDAAGSRTKHGGTTSFENFDDWRKLSTRFE